MAGLMGGSSARCRVPVYYTSRLQQACPKGGQMRFALCCFLLHHSAESSCVSHPPPLLPPPLRLHHNQPAGREMFALVMNDSSRTERSFSSVRAFVSKLGSGKRNVSQPARQETSGGAESTITSLLHKCLHVFLSLSVQFYKIPQL